MFVGLVVQFSQGEYTVNESAGYASLKVNIIGHRNLPISFKYKVFVSSTEFQPYPGLYVQHLVSHIVHMQFYARTMPLLCKQ